MEPPKKIPPLMEDYSPYLLMEAEDLTEEEEEAPIPRPKKFISVVNGVKMLLRKSVSNFTSREEELKQLEEALDKRVVSNHINVAITGAPGVGKTELTLKVVAKLHHQFDHILWINCSSEQTMKQDLNLIAGILNNYDLGMCSINDNMQVLIHNIYKHCNNYKCLFIFDNVTNHRFFNSNFLPPLGTNRNNIYILLTSYYKEWDSECDIHLSNFTTEVAEAFLKKEIKEITDDEASTIAKIMDNLPFGLQITIKYIEHQNDLKYYDNDVYTVDDFINDNFIENVLEFTLGTNEKVKYTKSFFTLYSDLIKNIILERQGGLSFNLLLKLSLLYPKYIPIGLFKFRKDAATDDLSANEAVLTLEKYSMVDMENNLINISAFTQIVMRKKYSETLTSHIETVVKMIVDKTQTSDEATPMLDDPVYLSSLWSAWGIWQSLENRPDLPLHMSLVPYIIANSNLGRSEEIISYFDSCDAVNLRELGWNNESYIGLKAALIRHHFKLKHYNTVYELCKNAEENIPDGLNNTKPALEILHYKAGSLQKLQRYNQAFTIAKDCIVRRIKYQGTETASYLKTLKRMCAIVTKVYESDPKTLLLPLFLKIYDSTMHSDNNYLVEKVAFIPQLEKYFNALGVNLLCELYQKMTTFLLSQKDAEEGNNLSFPGLRDHYKNYNKHLRRITRKKALKVIYTSSSDEDEDSDDKKDDSDAESDVESVGGNSSDDDDSSDSTSEQQNVIEEIVEDNNIELNDFQAEIINNDSVDSTVGSVHSNQSTNGPASPMEPEDQEEEEDENHESNDGSQLNRVLSAISISSCSSGHENVIEEIVQDNNDFQAVIINNDSIKSTVGSVHTNESNNDDSPVNENKDEDMQSNENQPCCSKDLEPSKQVEENVEVDISEAGNNEDMVMEEVQGSNCEPSQCDMEVDK